MTSGSKFTINIDWLSKSLPAANTRVSYAAQVIGQQWGHGEDKNTAAQLAAHAILGVTLAYILTAVTQQPQFKHLFSRPMHQ